MFSIFSYFKSKNHVIIKSTEKELLQDDKGENHIMKKRFLAILMTCMMMTLLFTACGSSKKDEAKTVKLDPDNPVTLKVWHYYNGNQQATFDKLLEKFNSTVGKEQGIYVEGYGHGSVSDLEQALTSSVNEEVGAEDMPDIFSTYADTAYSIQKKGKLADLSPYFTKEELSKYVDSYIKEGYLNNDKKLYLLPVAKSTEVLLLNKTDWEPFAKAMKVTTDDLKTTEGITKVAKKYYEWTDAKTPNIPNDGKAFYGRDSMSNYFVIGMKQMGQELFKVKDGKVTVNVDKSSIKRLWENYYVPYVSGYFASYGRFRSDDVKTGNIIAYTGSTSSAFYFPDQVEEDKGSHKIDYEVLEAPIMKGGENYKVQQGAGMAVTKSDDKHEYAATVFLKWFSKKKQNLEFVCESSYMPVLKESNNMKSVDQMIKDKKIKVDDKTYSCLKNTLDNFDKTKFYTTKTFKNGYNMRKVLDYNLSDQAVADKAAIEKEIKAGASRESVLKKYTSDKKFDTWYQEFCNALEKAQEAK